MDLTSKYMPNLTEQQISTGMKPTKIASSIIGTIEGVKRMANRKPYGTFSFYALNRITSKHYASWNFNPFNYYEFGTGTGNSLRMYLKSLKKITRIKGINIEKFNVFLFDSFSGLPEQTGTPDRNPAWNKGDFSGSESYLKDVIDEVCGKRTPIVHFIKGYYEESLTGSLKKYLMEFPPSIVNIDVDLYSSTKTVLNWIETLLQNGTLMHFDDIFEYLGNPFSGELAAINEFNVKAPEERLIYPFHTFGVSGVHGKIYTFGRRDINSN